MGPVSRSSPQQKRGNHPIHWTFLGGGGFKLNTPKQSFEAFSSQGLKYQMVCSKRRLPSANDSNKAECNAGIFQESYVRDELTSSDEDAQRLALQFDSDDHIHWCDSLPSKDWGVQSHVVRCLNHWAPSSRTRLTENAVKLSKWAVNSVNFQHINNTVLIA